MNSVLVIFAFLGCIFWGCAHIEVVHDKIKEGDTFFLALTFGIFWLLIGMVGFTCWFGPIVLEYFLS